MSDGRPPASQDDVDALAAVWGREASATALPVPRPARPDRDLGPGSEPPAGGDRRRRGGVLLLGGVAVVVVGRVAAVLVLGRDEPSEPEAATDGMTTTTEPAITDRPADPAWVADVSCLPLIDGDDERACVRRCDDALAAAPAGDGVVVLTGPEALAQAPVVGGSGPILDLRGRAQTVLAGNTLPAWGALGVLVADTSDLGRALHLDVDGVRQAVAGSTHLVVSTVDEVRAYPR